MALITLNYIFSVGTTIIASQTNLNNSTVYNDYNGNITDVNISPTAGIEYTKLALNNTIKSTDILSTTNFSPSNTGSGMATAATVLLGSGAWGSIPYIKLLNSQSLGVAGGTATSGSWLIIPINTIDTDTGSNVVSNSSSVGFILVAGTYEIIAVCPFNNTGGYQTRLFNNTGSSLLLTGESGEAPTVSASFRSNLLGRFTVAAAQTLQFQYQVSSTQATNGIGFPSNFGTEIYAQIIMHRVA